ncbi:unnamed protein product [Paramecium primaurelia]|uniref:Uncharacterized protein n=1 Tax=Paramecium primaurelia TaxID=5886 RepID=A0A8S1NP33_PARPR|nr:unnamed protein product [Paramecium primaurelia]
MLQHARIFKGCKVREIVIIKSGNLNKITSTLDCAISFTVVPCTQNEHKKMLVILVCTMQLQKFTYCNIKVDTKFDNCTYIRCI